MGWSRSRRNNIVKSCTKIVEVHLTDLILILKKHVVKKVNGMSMFSSANLFYCSQVSAILHLIKNKLLLIFLHAFFY